jgi:hypothetical protein
MSSLDRFRVVRSHGKDIKVLDEEPDPPARKTRGKKEGGFSKVPLNCATKATQASKTPGSMVLVLLPYLAWKHRSTTFPLSNEILKQYGVGRDAKHRALKRLENAGVIKVDQRGSGSPIVTLLDELA